MYDKLLPLIIQSTQNKPHMLKHSKQPTDTEQFPNLFQYTKSYILVRRSSFETLYLNDHKPQTSFIGSLTKGPLPAPSCSRRSVQGNVLNLVIGRVGDYVRASTQRVYAACSVLHSFS